MSRRCISGSARRALLTAVALLSANSASFAIEGWSPTTVESPRSMVIELRFGSYRPGIDDQFDLRPGEKGPYAEIFDDKSPFLALLNIEYHIIQRFGTLSAGVGLGLWSVDGKGFAVSEASDDTSMRVIPLMGQVSYRLDSWQHIVPLVPVARLGLDYYAWTIYDGAGDVARFEPGAEAKGGTWGWHYTLGVHLHLDFLAPEMAADFDNDAGVNNSYLTFEYQTSRIDDFGSSTSFRLGSDIFLVGLALDL